MSLKYGKNPPHFAALYRPHRLAWPRTLPFQGSNTGSNPVGDTSERINAATRAAFERFSLQETVAHFISATTFGGIMSTVFLHPKRKTFYHRSIIPRRLQPYFKGREQLWRSLKTEDKDQATLKSAQWTTRIQRLFLTLKKQGERMTNEEREALVTHWLEVELDEAEDARTLAGYITDDHREGVWHVLSDQMDDTYEALVTNNWRKVEREADDLLKSAGIPSFDREGAEFGRLCRRLLLAKQEY